MLDSNKALRAIHTLLLLTRRLAYEGCDSKTMASILDDIENLVALLLEPKPDATRFRSYLADLESKMPQLQGGLSTFDTIE